MRAYMGVETQLAPALYVTCEDGADELERRQKAICKALGSTVGQSTGGCTCRPKAKSAPSW